MMKLLTKHGSIYNKLFEIGFLSHDKIESMDSLELKRIQIFYFEHGCLNFLKVTIY